MIEEQHPLIIVSPVDPSKLELLTQLLSQVQNPDIESNKIVPFHKIKSVHFARFVIIQADLTFPVQLAFSSDFDGDEQLHISELIKEANEGLCQIYSCCMGFNGDLRRYWATYDVATKAFYSGHLKMPQEQIKREIVLREEIAGFLNQAYKDGTVQHLSAIEIKQMVAASIKQDSKFGWLDSKVIKPAGFFSKNKTLLAGLATLLIALIIVIFLVVKIAHLIALPVVVGLLILLACLIILFFLVKKKLNRSEASDVTGIDPGSPKHANELMNAENFQVQNQLTHLVEIKAGSFRLRLLNLVLGLINFLAKTVYNKGKLGGIPSIHFARWLMIDHNKRLLFFSNFDGSWESYLGDFVDKAAVGLTGVWSNAKYFPRTRNLVQQGATDEQLFKEWARYFQISTQVWYSAYKTLSVENINNNALIRSGLLVEMNEHDAQLWLDQIFYYNG